jgi:hypothetical protein
MEAGAYLAMMMRPDSIMQKRQLISSTRNKHLCTQGGSRARKNKFRPPAQMNGMRASFAQSEHLF